LISAHTVNLDNSKTIDWSDPTQIFILSTDGQEKNRTWSVVVGSLNH
jgi:hypothetical protein